MRLWRSPTLQTLGAVLLVGVAQVVGITFLSLGMSVFALALPITTNPWTVFLSVYAHGSVGHLVANGIALLIFGLLVERYTTATRFHLFFLASGIIAGMAETLVGVTLGDPVAVLGASGAIFALMGYFLTGNVAVGSLMESVDLGWKAKTLLVLVTAGGLTQATAGPGVALVAHFTGLVIGMIAGRFRLLHEE